jgi:hypothetical protein
MSRVQSIRGSTRGSNPTTATRSTTPPGDTQVGDKFNQYHFPFDRYGVRVPAVIVSPLIPANLIDHRLYAVLGLGAVKILFGAAGDAGIVDQHNGLPSRHFTS